MCGGGSEGGRLVVAVPEALVEQGLGQHYAASRDRYKASIAEAVIHNAKTLT